MFSQTQFITSPGCCSRLPDWLSLVTSSCLLLAAHDDYSSLSFCINIFHGSLPPFTSPPSVSFFFSPALRSLNLFTCSPCLSLCPSILFWMFPSSSSSSHLAPPDFHSPSLLPPCLPSLLSFSDSTPCSLHVYFWSLAFLSPRQHHLPQVLINCLVSLPASVSAYIAAIPKPVPPTCTCAPTQTHTCSNMHKLNHFFFCPRKDSVPWASHSCCPWSPEGRGIFFQRVGTGFIQVGLIFLLPFILRFFFFSFYLTKTEVQ